MGEIKLLSEQGGVGIVLPMYDSYTVEGGFAGCDAAHDRAHFFFGVRRCHDGQGT